MFAGGVLSLAEFDDGSGPALYAGGYFSAVNGLPARHLARWDGTTWFVPGLVQGLDPINAEWVSARRSTTTAAVPSSTRRAPSCS